MPYLQLELGADRGQLQLEPAALAVQVFEQLPAGFGDGVRVVPPVLAALGVVAVLREQDVAQAAGVGDDGERTDGGVEAVVAEAHAESLGAGSDAASPCPSCPALCMSAWHPLPGVQAAFGWVTASRTRLVPPPDG